MRLATIEVRRRVRSLSAGFIAFAGQDSPTSGIEERD
jgi:hypothetical protein